MYTAAKRILTLLLCALCCLPAAAAREEAFVPTVRHTKPAPPQVHITEQDLSAYTLLYETSDAEYYWREDRDIIAVLDKANGYVWKTGADIGFPKQVQSRVKEAESAEEKLRLAEPLEKSMNSTYIGVANSLITAEYRDGKTFYAGSAAEKGVDSLLSAIPGEPGRFLLSVDFLELQLRVEVEVACLKKGLRYDIKADGISGPGKSKLTAIWITPFLGASGGEAAYFDPDTGDYGEPRPKYAPPGYAMVPDGSGALIRFQDNQVPFVEYVGDVYGQDPAIRTYYASAASDAVPLRNPLMPVFGIAHGDRQAAFVAYAEEGAEYMSVVMRPEENLRLKYNFCYPRFEYNVEYYKVYNRKGSGYFTMTDEAFRYDVRMVYLFLHGDGSDGSPAADYTGMAQAYRRHLIEEGVLREAQPASPDIPVRLDFILSDMKKSILGHEQVVVTNARQVGEILQQVRDSGVSNITGSLTGWQAGAETLARPDSFRFHRAIGSEGEIARLFREQAAQGATLSLAREYTLLNSRMTSYTNVAAKHINTWYLLHDKSWVFPSAPISEFSYARPDVAASWVREIARRAAPFSTALTVSGITGTLTSSYDRNGVSLTLPDGIRAVQDALSQAGQQLELDLVAPNLYLWQTVHRFLNAPVGGSRHVFETDEVPFLQMVLCGSMEVYGPYCNFSFYTREDVLRMIDYHLYPAFILSYGPSHLLADTLSGDLYSTQYEQYRQLIPEIYGQVNAVLREVGGYKWVSRFVPQAGLVVNRYEKDGQKALILVNYTPSALSFEGQTVGPQSALCVKEAPRP